MRTDDQRITDTYQPMQPWVIRYLLGPLAGRLWALSMCSPTPEMVQVALESFDDLDPCFVYALQSSSFRRRYRKTRKKEMLPGLKVEAKEHKWKLGRLFLEEMSDSLRRRGYQPDDSRISKVSKLQAEYYTRTEEILRELNERPGALSEVLPPDRTLGYVRAKNALPLLGGKDSYYANLISLIYEIRCQPDKMKLSLRHVDYLIRGLAERLPREISRLIEELKSFGTDRGESGLRIHVRMLVDKLLDFVSAEDKMLPILPILMRYFLIETIPSTPGDEASSHKRLPLDGQIEEQVADGQEFIGAWRATPGGRKPMYKLPTQQEPVDDSERLSQFAFLAGINLDDYTPKEQERILDLFDFFDRGNEKSSKTGISFRDYYGAQADSEKTKRYRLFKKIKDPTSHDSVRD